MTLTAAAIAGCVPVEQEAIKRRSIVKTWTYRGIEITLYPTGWYSAWVSGYGYLKADTLQGMKEIIRDTLTR